MSLPFGAKPQRTRNRLEALLRRMAAGLPRVNRITDVYNAVSITHGIPSAVRTCPTTRAHHG
ncbi:hypothetical protein [Micromonospora ureilytica]|uniref:DNA/RNA-binding domain of Phe-tRNA-synthetase-like protein n=1 Tax=Micromonospora ureilytica TaxID=709868 RepID=A0ABS0JJT7_9ACTN|nr:hypothetical protein [Micromonospora ureilytica]MBG6067005.1 DNA/RNA-binding domain of Phe-tRNA-synthetase-like protein [Micromonospora ureilytica]